MIQRGKSLEVLYKRYNPFVRSVSSIGLQNQKEKTYKKPNHSRFRSRKPLKNPRDLIVSEPKPKQGLPQNYSLGHRKPKYKQEVFKKEKPVTAFPIFVTKSQFALQRKGSVKSLVVNPSKVKITRRIVHRKVRRSYGAVQEFVPIRRKYKMIASNKKPPPYKMSKSSMDQIKNIAKREESKSDDMHENKKKLNENERVACGNNESKNLDNQKKTSDIYGNLLGPTPDEAILAGLQTVIEMCSIVDRKPVKKRSIQEVNKQKIMDWVESEYILLNEESKTSTSDLSIENLSERKETLQEIEVLVRKKYDLENKGAQLKIENENLCKSNSLSVCYATQPSTISDLDLQSLDNSSEMLNAVRLSHSIRSNNLKTSKPPNIVEVYSKPVVLPKKNQFVQTVCVCDKSTQVMEALEEKEPSLSESIKSITITSSKASGHSIASSETSSLSLIEIQSSAKNLQTCSLDESFKCSHITRSTQFVPDLPLVCIKSTQFSETNCECQKCESSSKSSSSSYSSEESSDPIPPTRPQIVNYFKVYTNKKALSTTSSNASIKLVNRSSSKVKSTSNLTTETIEVPRKLIEKSSKSVMVKCTPIKLDTTSSTPHVPLKSVSTSTTELKPIMISKIVNILPEQSTKAGQTIESKPCLHVENFTPLMIEPMLPIIPEIDFSEKSIQTYDTSGKSSHTIPAAIVSTQSIQSQSKSQSTIDLMSKHAQTSNLCYPCMRSTHTMMESVATSMEAQSSTLMVQKSVQTKITYDQSLESPSDTTSTCVTTTDETTSGTSLTEESSSCDVSSKPTVDKRTFQCSKDVTNVTTQCDSTPQSNAATDPFSMKIASCQTSLSHWKCIANDYPFTSTTACCTCQNVPAYQMRGIQMCSVNTCPMLQEAMVNIIGVENKKTVQTNKRSYSSSRIQVCSTSTCPMLKSASVNICANMKDPQYKFMEESDVNKRKTKRRIQMCSSRNCRMLKEAIINITNFDSEQQKGDNCNCKISKLPSVKRSKKGSIQKGNAKTCPILHQAIVNICSIEDNTNSSNSVAPKCSCYKAKQDDAYITCKELPIRACTELDDCFCNDEVEEEELEDRKKVESLEKDTEEEEEEEESVFEEKIIVARENKVDKNKKVDEREDEIKKELEVSKLEIKEINEPERIEVRQEERVFQESSSYRAITVNKDKGNSKPSTQKIRQPGQTVKRAIHIRIPSPTHNLPSGAVWVIKK